jgi:hypothetical protein
MKWDRHEQGRVVVGRPATGLDRRDRHRPLDRRGRGRGAGGQACGGPRRPRQDNEDRVAGSGVVVANYLLSAVGAGRRLPAGSEVPAGG